MNAAHRAAPSLVAELFWAANEIESVSVSERVLLLKRAASTIGEMRADITFTGPSASASPGAIAEGLLSMAEAPQTVTSETVALALLNAAYVIKTIQSMLACGSAPTEVHA